MNNSEIVVKVNYKLKEYGNKIKCDARINYISANEMPYAMLGGGYSGPNKCSFMFKADSFSDAKKIMKNNPMLSRWILNHKDLEYNYTILPVM